MKQNKILKLGFDISTNNSGYALIIDDQLVASGEIAQKNQDKNLGMRMAADLNTIETNLLSTDIFRTIRAINDEYKEELKELFVANITEEEKNDEEKLKAKKAELYKEASKPQLIVVLEANKINVGQDTKQKMDLYIGMYMATLVSTLNLMAPHIPKLYKLATPTDWHRKTFGFEPERAEGKALSIKKAEEKFNIKVAGDDEADAINIADIADQLLDMGLIYNRKQDRAKKLKQLRGQLPRAEALVKKYELIEQTKNKQGKNLTKAEATVKENNIAKVEQIKNEIKQLTGKVYKEA